jgi:SAM-dependent methyltransferase
VSQPPAPVYDRIGVGYARQRRPDPGIAAQIAAALGGARRVINVGAGAGSYEPVGTVAAFEPSTVMLAQRPAGAAPAVRAVAEALPAASGAADAALAALTVHHWSDPAQGLAELVRVAPARTVVLTWDPAVTARMWLFTDYLPEVMVRESGLCCAAQITALLEALGRTVHAEVVLVPATCTDGFAAAHWARPHAYLDPDTCASMSALALLDPAVLARGLAALRADLHDGRWQARNAELLTRDSYDAGYRLLVATPA